MPTIIQMRRDTAANWTSTNPVLAAGEWGYETNTGFLKIGNGTLNWGALSYVDRPAITDLPSGSVFAFSKIAGVWQNRPTSRTDVSCLAIGAAPGPAIVTPPALNGMYEGDVWVGF